jgi:hypothetical protein
VAGRRGGSRGGGGRGGPNPGVVLRLIAFAFAVLCLATAFGPMTRPFLRGLKWALALFAVLEAGVSVGRGRRGAFFAYAAIAVLVNPIVPFTFTPQIWRLLFAGSGLWLAADHLPNRD